jgi:hypothetical protein
LCFWQTSDRRGRDLLAPVEVDVLNHGLTMAAIFCQPSTVRNLKAPPLDVSVVRQGFARPRRWPSDATASG